MQRLALVLVIASLVAGCATGGAFRRGESASRAGDWDTACAATQLVYDANGDIWRNTFNVAPGGAYEYKVALNGSWDVNYGLHALQNGPNIPLALAAPQPVTFYYDHKTHWVTENVSSIIATVPGSFQSEIGCSGDWDPSCFRSWLEDVQGSGIYSFSTNAIPAGSYECKVALNGSWDVNYGAGGAQNGPNIAFSVPANGMDVEFEWNSNTKVLRVIVGGIQGDLSKAQAYWLTADTIAWNVPTDTAVSQDLGVIGLDGPRDVRGDRRLRRPRQAGVGIRVRSLVRHRVDDDARDEPGKEGRKDERRATGVHLMTAAQRCGVTQRARPCRPRR